MPTIGGWEAQRATDLGGPFSGLCFSDTPESLDPPTSGKLALLRLWVSMVHWPTSGKLALLRLWVSMVHWLWGG